MNCHWQQLGLILQRFATRAPPVDLNRTIVKSGKMRVKLPFFPRTPRGGCRVHGRRGFSRFFFTLFLFISIILKKKKKNTRTATLVSRQLYPTRAVNTFTKLVFCTTLIPFHIFLVNLGNASNVSLFRSVSCLTTTETHALIPVSFCN